MAIGVQLTTGAIASSTVTIAVHDASLPELSVTVSVTVFSPISLQVNSFTSRVRSAMVQLSVLPPSISAAVIVAMPAVSSCAVISRHTATGASVSLTATVVSHVLLLPEVSVTVSVTATLPRLSWVKVSGSTVVLAMAQLSVLPRAMASISACVRV